MRRESPAMGTVVSGVFALWALAVAIAAWLGLGSRLPAADAVVEPQPLPVLPVLASERLGELSHYPQVVNRPLFNENRRPQPYYIGGDPGQQAASLRLSGVLITPQLRMATLSGEGGLSLRLQLGGPAVQGWQLLELSERQATVLGPSGSQVLPLAVHAGSADAATDATAVAPARPGLSTGPGASPATGTPAAVNTASATPATTPAAATPAAEAAAQPSAAQMQAIRARIQARREQMQQNNNGSTQGQNR